LLEIILVTLVVVPEQTKVVSNNMYVIICLIVVVMVVLPLPLTFFGLAMWRKFSTNVDAENQTLFNHKCVCGELNRHIAKPMLVAVNLSLL
uniref:hypothetical protein n=1 Tax=Algoriphagus sp. TaxID=1872435 RepID=UPI004048E1DA